MQGDRERRRRFRPGLVATLVTAVALVILLALGTWQARRLAWKSELIATAEARLALPAVDLDRLALDVDPAALDFRRVTARGTYRHEHAFGLGAAAVDGRIGGRLVTPLRLADGRVLLVERGWLPEELLPPRVPPALEPAAEPTVTGVLRRLPEARPSAFVPDNEPARRRWFWLDRPALEATLGAPMLPWRLVLERTGAETELPRAAAVTADFRNNHLGYAVTWYGLAAALVVVYIAFGLKRGETG